MEADLNCEQQVIGTPNGLSLLCSNRSSARCYKLRVLMFGADAHVFGFISQDFPDFSHCLLRGADSAPLLS